MLEQLVGIEVVGADVVDAGSVAPRHVELGVIGGLGQRAVVEPGERDLGGELTVLPRVLCYRNTEAAARFRALSKLALWGATAYAVRRMDRYAAQRARPTSVGLLVGLLTLGFLVGDNYGCSRVQYVHSRVDAAPYEEPRASPAAGTEREVSLREAEPGVAEVEETEPSGRNENAASSEGRRLARYRPLHIPDCPEVARYVHHYSGTSAGRATFGQWLARAGQYAAMIRSELTVAGLPEDLLAVALIESGMQTSAVSPAGATGLWQFIQETARIYGLRIDEEIDERRNPERATAAAARHLHDLHGIFRDWPLALAAYNAGAGRIEEIAATQGSADFWTIARRSESLPDETRDYVPKVLAAAALLRDLKAHGFAPIAAVSHRDLTGVRAMVGQPLASVADAIGMEQRELRKLNPALIGGIVPSGQTETRVSVPVDRRRLVELLVPETEIADRRLIARVVRLGRAVSTPRPGGSCRFGSCRVEPDQEGWARLLRTLGEKEQRVYRVQSGDTLQQVADVFGVDARHLMDTNQVRDARRIQVGQLLRLPPGAREL